MSNEIVEGTIIEGFNCEETTQDKKYYLDSLNDLLSSLYREIEEIENDSVKIKENRECGFIHKKTKREFALKVVSKLLDLNNLRGEENENK